MGGTDIKEELNEKAFEIILGFKPSDKYDKAASKEILELKQNILKLISLLSKTEQEILGLRFSQNLSKDKIAEKLGKSSDEVAKVISKSLRNIRQKINQPELFAENINKIINFPKANNLDSKTEQNKSKVISAGVKVSPKKVFIGISIVLLLIVLFGNIPFFRNAADGIKAFLQERSSAGNLYIKKRKDIIIPNKINISGSTSLFELARKWENSFSVSFPAYSIALVSSDSNRGINSLIEGNSDIANSSRPLSFNDKKKANGYGIELAENRVALDALIVITNKNNPLEEISTEELQQIFRGEIMSWVDFSKGSERGFQSLVLPVARETGSGTNEFFRSRILEGDEFNSLVLKKDSNKEIFDFIAGNKGAIGFINSTNYPWNNGNIKYLKIKNYADSQAYSPFNGNKLNEVAVRYGDYPLAHYLYLVTLSNRSLEVNQFISWVLGKEGQRIVRYSGLIPVFDEG